MVEWGDVAEQGENRRDGWFNDFSESHFGP
jgi:hypothetical protein